MVSLQGSGSGYGGAGDSTFEMIRLRSRMNLLERVVPELSMNNPESAVAMAMAPTSEYGLVQGAIGAVGLGGVEQMIDELNSAESDYARAQFALMPSGQQDVLLSYGYKPPADDGNRSFLQSVFSPRTLPGTSFLKKWGQEILPGMSPTGGNIQFGSYTGGIIGDVGTSVASVIGLPASALGEALGGEYGILAAMDGAWDLTTRVIRTGTDLNELNGGSGGFLDSENPLSAVLNLGGLGDMGRGFGSALLSPSQIVQAWHDVDDGDQYFTREHRARARGVLQDGDIQNVDEVFRMAQMRVGGKELGEIAEELTENLLPGSPEWSQEVMRISETLNSEAVIEAMEVMERGKVSFGRETARQAGLAEDLDMWSAYSITSGVADALSMVFLDPTNLLGSSIVRSRHAYGFAARAGSGPENMRELAKLGRYVDAANRGDSAARALAEEGFRNRGTHFRRLLGNRASWQEAESVNRWVHLTAETFEAVNKSRVSGVREDVQEAIKAVDLYFNETSGVVGAWDKLRRHHDEVGDLSSFDAVWEMLASDEGVDLVANTTLGGFQQNYRMLPRIDRKQRMMNTTKDWFRTAFDPGEGLESIGLDALQGDYNKLDEAMHAIEHGDTVDFVPGAFDELGNWQDKVKDARGRFRKPKNLMRSMFYHQPHSNIFDVTTTSTVEEFRRLVQQGALVNMPTNLIDEMIGSYALGNEAERYLLVETFMKDFFARSGIISEMDQAGQQLLNRYVRRYGQHYALSNADVIGPGGMRSRATLAPDIAEASDRFAIPNFKELAYATREMNKTRHAMGRGLNPRQVDAFVTKVWAPAQLLRPGFIIRASGEMMIHYILRRSPGEYARAKLAMRASGMRKTRGGYRAITDLDTYARHLGLVDEQGKRLEGVFDDFDELHELTVMRPILWLGHQVGEWSRLLGEGFLDDVEILATRRAELSGRIWTDLDEVGRKPWLDAAANEIRQAKPIKSAIVDTYEAGEAFSMRGGMMLHEIAQNRGFLTKQQIWDINRKFSRSLHTDDPLASRFATEADVGAHVGHLMHNNPVIANAISEQMGGIFRHYEHRSANPIARQLDENFGSIGGKTGPRYIHTAIDPSNMRGVGRADQSEFYDALAGLHFRTMESPSMAAATEEMFHYIAREDIDELYRFFRGAGVDSQQVVDLLGPDGGLEGLKNIRKTLDDHNAVGALRTFYSDPTPANEKALRRIVDSIAEARADVGGQDAKDLVSAMVHGMNDLTPQQFELLLSKEFDVNRMTMDLEEVLERARKASRTELYRWTRSRSLRGSARQHSPTGSIMARAVPDNHSRVYMPAFDRGQTALIDYIAKTKDGVFQAILIGELDETAVALGVEPGHLAELFWKRNDGQILTELSQRARATAGEDFMTWGFGHTDPEVVRTLNELVDRALTKYLDEMGPEFVEQMGLGQMGRGALARRQRLAFLDLDMTTLSDGARGGMPWGGIPEQAKSVKQLEAELNGVNGVLGSDFWTISPQRQFNATVMDPDASEWQHLVRFETQNGNSHTLSVSAERFLEMEKDPELVNLEKLSTFFGSGQTEELGVGELVAAQIEELLFRQSTIRNKGVQSNRMMHEILAPMLRGEDITNASLHRLTNINDLPQQAYAPTIISPNELSKGRFIDALKGFSNAGFQNVITPAINASMYQPQMHAAMTDAFRYAYPRFRNSEAAKESTVLVRSGGRQYAEKVGMTADDLDGALVRLIEHDYVAHPDGVITMVKGDQLVPAKMDGDVVERTQKVMDSLARDSAISHEEFMARWLDYSTDGKKFQMNFDEAGLLVDPGGTVAVTAGEGTAGDLYRMELEDLREHPVLGEDGRDIDSVAIRRSRAAELRGSIRRTHVEYREMEQSLIDGAFARFTPFIDDHRVRSQFQGHVGGLIPFWFAEEQFIKRWAKGFYETPHQLRKGQIMMNGLRNMGFLDTDEYGNEVFVYPGSELLVEAIAPFAPLAFGGTGLGDAVTGPMSTNVEYMFPGMNDSPGKFGFGPWAVVVAHGITEVFPEFQATSDIMLGDLGANRWDPGTTDFDAVLSSLMPSSAARLFRSIGRIPDQQELLSAQMQALAVMAATDGLPDPALGAMAMQDFIAKARNMARTIIALRGFSGFTLGATSNVTLDGIEFREDFREFLEAGLPFPDAVEALQAKYAESGEEVTPWTVFATESVSGAPIPATEQSLNYMQDNKDFLEMYPELGPWFLPQDKRQEFGILERRARNTAIADGLRQQRSPEEYVRALYTAEASEQFFDTDDQYQVLIETVRDFPDYKRVVEEEYRTWKSSYLAMHPVFAEEISTRDGAIRRSRLIDQARLVVADIENAPGDPEFLRFLSGVVGFQDQMDSLKYISTDTASDLRRMYRRQFYNLAQAAVRENPQLAAFFNSVVRPMIGSNEITQIEAGLYGRTAA